MVDCLIMHTPTLCFPAIDVLAWCYGSGTPAWVSMGLCVEASEKRQDEGFKVSFLSIGHWRWSYMVGSAEGQGPRYQVTSFQ